LLNATCEKLKEASPPFVQLLSSFTSGVVCPKTDAVKVVVTIAATATVALILFIEKWIVVKIWLVLKKIKCISVCEINQFNVKSIFKFAELIKFAYKKLVWTIFWRKLT